jgi:acetylornithine deacetylase/succinyl-diaminopimelate desuccinylase-like protein
MGISKGAAVALALSLGVAAWAQPPARVLAPPADIALGREIFKELIEIDSTHAKGSSLAAHVLEKRLIAAGFDPADVIFLAPTDHPTKGNLVVRLRGKAKAKPVLFIGHLDVVEARAEDWSVAPFKFTEQDGQFYGRGTADMKDGDAALAETLIRLKREKFVPGRDIVVAFTADEEAGGDANGPAFLLAEHRDLVDAALVLNFDDGGGGLKDGKRHGFHVGTSEKVYATFSVEATGPGGHGSLPGPDNPIYRVADGLSRLEAYRFPVMLSDTTRDFFTRMAALDSGPDSADMRAVAGASPDAAAADRLSQDPFDNALLRTTCVATLISGGHAENALPQRAKATIQCRMLPEDRIDLVQARIAAALADPKLTLTLDAPPIQAPASPLDPAVTAKLRTVIRELWGEQPLISDLSTGFSDARRFRAAGMPTYGVGGIWKDETENRVHGRDERVPVVAFDESLEYTYRLVKAFGAAP